MTNKEIKQRYFAKIYKNAKTIQCGCGCGRNLKNKDRYGRNKLFINGHNNRRYTNPTQYKREWNHRNRQQRYNYKKIRSYKLKGDFIKQLGGQCNKCGLLYDGTNACCFDFHHKEPKTKRFNLGVSNITTFSLDDIHKELSKCIILCANCHRLEHSAKY